MLELENLKRFRDFKFEIITLIPEWANAYDVDTESIIRQIPIAHAWCNANPKKAPKKDPVRFLHNWMRLAKKMNNLLPRPPALYKEVRPIDDEVLTWEDIQKSKKEITNNGN